MLRRLATAMANEWLATLMMVLTVLYFIEHLMLPRRVKESMLMVGPLAVVMLAFYLYLVLRGVLSPQARQHAEQQGAGEGAGRERAEPDRREARDSDWSKVVFVLLVVIYIALITRIGFEVSTLLFMASTLYFCGVRRPGLLAGYALAYAVVVIFVFYILLQVPLPMRFL